MALAKKYLSQLHVLYITSEKELNLVIIGEIEHKHIMTEAYVHHLWLCDQDCSRLGNVIKCNPAIKASTDRHALIQALHNDKVDIIATDHALHAWEEKS